MRCRPFLLQAVVAGGLVAAAAALHADVVTTKDGLVLEGTVTKGPDGAVTIAGDDGEARLAADRVASIVPGEGPRAAARRAIAALPKDDAAGHYRMAVTLEAQGLADLARSEFEAVIAADPDHPAARRALGFEREGAQWLTTTEARRRRGLVLYKGEWMLPAEMNAKAKGKAQVAPKDTSLVAAMRTAATTTGPLLAAARARIARASTAERAEAATALLVHRDPGVRAWACRTLAMIGDRGSLRPLIAVGARDKSEEVRKAAVAAAASFGDADVGVPFARALWSEHPALVANAAQALAWLGDGRGVIYLVHRIVSHGSSPGGYFAHVEEQAYVRDFDVEVAQTSFIADPEIGTLQQGAVQDVKVLDVTIETTYVQTVLLNSFNALAKAEAKSASDVQAWFKANGPALRGYDPPK